MTEDKIIPESLKTELCRALTHADDKKVIALIELYNIDLNVVFDSENAQTPLHLAVNSLSEFHGTQSQFNIVDYLVENGANPNLRNKAGFTPLHIALEYHNLSKVALTLILNCEVDIESVEKNGNNLIFTAVREYGKTFRDHQKEVNKLRVEIIEESLKQGANLDRVNNHGISTRRWLQIYDDKKLHKLIEQYDK